MSLKKILKKILGLSDNIIGRNVQIGKNFKIGKFCIIDDGAIIGDNVVIGNHVHIQEGCCIGHNTRIEHYVLLKKGTKIGRNCYVDSYFKSSGNNRIGNDCTLRFNSTVAREVTVKDNVFISPNVMTIYSDSEGVKHPGTVIAENSHIGTNAVIGAAVNIPPETKIGTLVYVRKDVKEPGKYVQGPKGTLTKLDK